jgi:tetratricopeptide (TPR) repeat protein
MKRLFFIIGAVLLIGAGVWAVRWYDPYARAIRFMDSGQPARAVEILADALDGNPPQHKIEPMRELLAKAYIGKGAVDSAEDVFKTILAGNSANFEATLGLGAINLLRDKVNFAIDFLEEAKKLRPNDSRPYFILAKVFLSRRDFDKAELVIIQALTLFPTDRSFQELAGELFLFQGRFHDALNQFTPLMEASPTDREIRRKVALTHLYSGDADEALAILDSLKPAWATDESWELARANIFRDLGRRDEALAVVQRLYSEDNRRVFSGMAWAVDLANSGRAKEASELLENVSLSVPPLGGVRGIGLSLNDLEKLQSVRDSARISNAYLSLAKATIAERTFRYADADGFLDKALNIDNGLFSVWERKTSLARLKGDADLQLKWANRAVERFNNHPAALAVKARALLANKMFPEAVAVSKKVADSYPRMADAQAIYARSLLAVGNKKDALAVASKSIEINSYNEFAQLAFALAQLANGNVFEAESGFRKAIDLDPLFAEARHYYGIFLASKGRQKEAAYQLDEAKRLEPSVYGKKFK